MKKAGFVMVMVLVGLVGQARPPSSKTARHYLQTKGEVYFSFERPFGEVSFEIFNALSIDKLEGNTVFAYANTSEFEKFLTWNIGYQVLEHPGDAQVELNMKTLEELRHKNLTASWDFYPTYEAYIGLMQSFQADFPDLCRIYNIGSTVEGRSLLFAKISANVNQRDKEPRFMYTSTIHGDETTGFVLSLRLIHFLLSNYGTNAQITNLLNNAEIWICPNENPDGTYSASNSTVSGATRGNAKNIDLNRNYPNPVNTPLLPHQPETIAMMNFVDTAGFVMSANIHGGNECVNYPFDTWTSDVRRHADHVWWQFVSKEYADTARFFSPANYMNPSGSNFINGVTHGGDWYVIFGGRQDYMNYFAGVRELTLELSNVKLLPANELPAHWNYNYRSLLNYINQALFGLRGTVTNATTGQPIKARIEIINHDQFNSEIWSHGSNGSFFRPLLEGIYGIRITAENFIAKEIPGVNIENYKYTELNVALEPNAGVGVDLVNSLPQISAKVYPNPIEQNSILKLSLSQPAELSIRLFDMNGRLISLIYEGRIGEGTSNLALSTLTPTLKPGLYLLQITHPGQVITLRIFSTNR